MKYEITRFEIGDDVIENVVIDNGDGSYDIFPVDPENPRYAQWKAEQDGTAVPPGELPETAA